MASKSLQLGDLADSSFLLPFIKSQFLTSIRRPPPDTNLFGQVAIITGGSSGLGFQCACHLLSLKLSRLVIAVPPSEEDRTFVKRLSAQYPEARIDVWPLEMTSYPSIREFCLRVATNLARLDFTILNAGVFEFEFGTCFTTGHERVIQINYLSTFLLATLMLPLSKSKAPEGSPGRLTIVSSGTALFAKFGNRDERPLLSSFDNPKALPWEPFERYASSKVLGHLFFARMVEHLNADDVVVNLVEPGLCKGTGIARGVTGIYSTFAKTFIRLAGRKPEDGAWAYVDAAVVKGRESHGCFCLDQRIHP